MAVEVESRVLKMYFKLQYKFQLRDHLLSMSFTNKCTIQNKLKQITSVYQTSPPYFELVFSKHNSEGNKNGVS